MRAVVYLRQSLDRHGTGAAVDRQREDAEKLAALRGWTIVATHADNDTSAAGGKTRPGFDATMRALENGDAEAVVSWSLDRLTRNRRDTLRLVETCEKARATVALVRGSDLDMSTPSGRLVADLLAATARSEIDVKGDRQRRALAQAASQGRPAPGRRPFGYDDDRVTIRPAEARLVRLGYERILAGGSLRGVAREWNTAGAVTSHGATWRPDSVRDVLLRARYAGLREYRGEVVAQGTWKPIVAEETWRAVVAVLTDPARRNTPDTRRKWLLSGLALCGVCAEPVTVNTGRTHRGRRTYKCSVTRHLSRAAEPVDELVRRLVIARLARDDAADLLVDDERPDVEALRTTAQTLRARLDALADDLGIDERTLARRARALRAELADVEGSMVHASRADVLGDLVRAGDPGKVWDGLDVDRQRAVIDTLMTVRLLPPGRGARTFDPATVEIVWRQP
ncbi:MAG: recombinase family protein [Gammaproteobacteria bacterium]